MLKNVLTTLLGLFLGILSGYLIITYLPENQLQTPHVILERNRDRIPSEKEVLGFLPYWFLDKARPDYSGYITILDYFSLTVDKDGKIQKYTSPGQSEPGYYALTNGKLDKFFANAKSRNIKLALTIFNGDQDSINELISNPISHADNLITDLQPVISQYGFTDLNIDIESVGIASQTAQINYQSFIHEIRQQISSKKIEITMSADIIPSDFIRNDRLSVPANLANDLSKIIIMAYDFHSPGSFVTGPVAPLYGAGSVAELDTQVVVNAALKKFDPSKILLGLPFYGYSWETIDNFERAATIPATSQIISNRDAEDLVAKCASCSANFDNVGKESYILYKNADTNTFQQIFYPDAKSLEAKINFANGNNLRGLAIWALGYESQSGNILAPIKGYLGK